MNTCSTCKFWKPVDEKYPNNFYEGIEKQGGFCEHPKLCENVGIEPHQLDALVYSYPEGGDFWTGPQFGCVHHGTKENQVSE